MSARPRRRAVGRLAMLVGAGTAVLVPLGAGALDPLRAAAADVYVAVVIDFGGGPGAPSDIVQCVSVPAGSTDAQALSMVDDHTTAYATSGLLCGIDTYPPDALANCRATSGDDYFFWSYWHGTGGTWVYANDGPAEQVVTSGEVEGWRFQDPGPASPSAPAPGTAPDFSAICADGAVQTTSGAASAAATGTATTPPSATGATATTGVAAPPATAPLGSGDTSAAAGAGASSGSGTAAGGNGGGSTGTAPASTATTVAGSRAGADAGGGGRGATSVTTTSAPASDRPSRLRGARALGRVGGPGGHGGGFPWPLVVTGVAVLGLALASLLRWRRQRGAL